MLIGFTAEQAQLREATRALLAVISGEKQVRALMPDPAGTDPAAWRQLCELGLPGIAVPERFGGGGGSAVDQGVVLEEMGRVLYCGPYFSTAVLAAQTLLAVPADPVAGELLHRICADGLTITLAVTEPDVGWWDETGVRTRAEAAAGGWRLSGAKTFVPDGAATDVNLVTARTGAGVSLFAVPGEAAGLTRVPLPAMDQTRKQARLEFDGAEGRLIGADGGGAAVQDCLRRAAVALAAEQVGGAQRVLELMVEHARTRQQFGRPIGSFQAVQHKCAALLMEVEAARSAAYHGLRVAAECPGELAAAASLAQAYCSEAYRQAADDAIQVFGGIALTWEHPVQLYFKRARSSEVFLGRPAYHRELLARELGL